MMKLATAFLLSAAGVASAGKSVEVPTNDIAASSPLGNRILSAARLLENNNNNNNNFSWISGYSIRFEKCATSDEYYGGYEEEDLGDDEFFPSGVPSVRIRFVLEKEKAISALMGRVLNLMTRQI